MNPSARSLVGLRLAALLLTALALLAHPRPASAHPFGPPPTAEASLREGSVGIVWRAREDDVLSLATSLSALAERVEMVFGPDGELVRTEGSQEDSMAGSDALRRYLEANIRGFQGGEACRTTVEDQADLVQGARLRVDCPLPVDDLELEVTMLHDLHPNYRTLLTAPGASPSRAAFSAGSPRHRMSFVGALDAHDADVSTPPAAVGVPLSGRMLGLIDGPAGLAALGIALLAGLLHGLAPGHAKAAGALFLAGSSARRRHAVLLGATVAGMHLASTAAFATALYLFTRVGSNLESVTRWLQLLAAVLVLAVGCAMLVRARQARAHDHDHGHPHHHGDSPFSRRGLAALALAGGVLPSPAAFLTLSTALFAGRLGFGVLLVAAFSVGLAVTVAGAGLLGIEGGGLARRVGGLSRRTATLAGALPVVAAVAVALLGGVMTVVSATRL